MSSSVDQVFRDEWPKLVATLMRDLRDLELAEDCAQEAFAEAATHWETEGFPDRPGAWLLTTARRRAIDRVRRSDRYRTKLTELEVRARRGPVLPPNQALIDDQLALVCGCCHPALGVDAQVALTLRVVAGLTTAEIAKAFLVAEATMSKRLTRAKLKIRKANIPFRAPERDELRDRLPAVLHVIYLVFTEGHVATSSTELVRGDLCDEALWLADLLCDLVPEDPRTFELAALLRLTDARRAARFYADGLPVLLEDQDRSLWDERAIAVGLDRLRRGHELGSIGAYGLQAAIAAVHASAPSFGATDWAAIVEIYDRILEADDSAVVRLNRAVALSYLDGPQAALDQIDALGAAGDLGDYHYLHSARGELLHRSGRSEEAASAYRRAIATCTNEAERRLLTARLTAVTGSDR